MSAPIVAILGLVLLESIALWKGIDGLIFTLVVATISGLGGYKMKHLLDRFK